jgi:hypothetical protein
VTRFILSFALSSLVTGEAYAHKTTLDSYGCHNNTATASYECHTGPMTGRTWPNPNGKTAMLQALAAVPPAPPLLILTGEVVLTWIANTEPDLAGYKIYWAIAPDQWQEPLSVGKVTTAQLTGLLKGAIYSFAITAIDTSGNESPKSHTASKSLKVQP